MKSYFGRNNHGGVVFYSKDIPNSLTPYLDYVFSSGPYTGDDFLSFDRKYKNVIKKLLPQGYEIYKWNKIHYESYAIIKTNNNKYIYLSYSDVRFFQNEWCTNILIRAMDNENDWKGDRNQYTNLYTFTQDIQELY